MTDFFHPFDINMAQKDPWRLFKIMSEFVNGFDALGTIGPSVSIFGSARMPQNNPYAKLAREVGHKVAEKGFSIITGGGPGLMIPTSQGARDAKANAIGLLMDFPMEEEPNKYINPKYALHFRYFFVRKVMFVRFAQGFVFLPGGYGTLDEMFEVMTLIQTKKTTPVPVFLAGSQFWSGLLDWIKTTLVNEKCVPHHDLNIFKVSDDPDEIAETISASYQQRLKSHEVEEIT